MHHATPNDRARDYMGEHRALVEQARAGNTAAFTALVRAYQEMALGYALTIIHDFHLAQDVTQEALFIAFRRLSTLEDAERFPAWLRGIVCFQCGRVLRRRRRDLVPLDYADGVVAPLVSPEHHLEIKEGFHRILAVIQDLPAPQREVALLFYIKDYAYRDIATFLGVPVTTVKNRLHTARTTLKERLAMRMPRVGRVVAVQSPVVDVQFSREEIPLILSALVTQPENAAAGVPLQVVQREGSGLVRCLARGQGLDLTPGMAVLATDDPLLAPIDAQMLTRALPILSRSRSDRTPPSAPDDGLRREILETGIKVIDLLSPVVKGGTFGLFGPSGTGRMVVSAEVLHNVARDDRGVTIFAFVHGEDDARVWYDTPDDVPVPRGTGHIVCLPLADATDAGSASVLAASPLLTARAFLSANRAKSGLYPAIDPLLSTSVVTDPALIGQDHDAVAQGVRALLRRVRDLQESAPDGTLQHLTPQDHLLVARARKLQWFFTQPFAVAESFTGRPAQVVPLAATIRACGALLAGAYDDLPEEAFLWRGTLDEVRPATP